MCGKRDIALLMAEGRWGGHGCLRYCCRIVPLQAAPAAGSGAAPFGECSRQPGLPAGETSPKVRVLVSVPKKHFKRAVKRNLLKRRIREAWRLERVLLTAGPESIDILFTYASDEVRSFEEIRDAMAAILSEISHRSR